ncbi:MAG: D-alanyl-D-alanine carboxypeptidase [Ruminococcaceae bacterium]|nr:D-alanyl-D-alanine carboxypeptidase [Oscillospiraceae bacterium]
MKKILSLLIIMTMLCTLVMPLCAADGVRQPELISESAVLMDAETGQVLWEKNMHDRKYPASITKIITVLLAVENLTLTDTIKMSEEAVHSVSRDSSHIALDVGEEITVEHAITAALLVSANDACNGIAEKVSGSVEKFAALMTEKAKEVGALGTNFNNANGLKDEKHYTTAYDMAMITRHAIKNETFRKYFGMSRYIMPPNNKQKEERIFNNQHSMITDPKFKYEGIVGGKAGYTTDAQYTLVTAAEREGRTLIAVVMRSPKLNDKYTDTKALLDYGFQNFTKVEFTPEDVEKTDIPVKNEKGDDTTLRLTMNEPVSFYVVNTVSKTDITQSFDLPDGKISKDSVVTLSFHLPDGVSGMYPTLDSYTYQNVILKSDEEAAALAAAGIQAKQGFFYYIGQFFKIVGIIALSLFGLLVLLFVALVIRKQRYLKRKRRRMEEMRRRRPR